MTMTTPEGREIHSALEEAIYLRLGGAVTACHTLGVSTQAVYKLLATGYVSSRKIALEIEQHSGVPAAELMQLAPWTGPSRGGSGPGKGRQRQRPKGSSPRLAAVQPRANSPEQPRMSLIAGSRGARVVRPAKGKRDFSTPEGSACSSHSLMVPKPAELLAA